MEKSSKTQKATSCDLSLERTLKSASSSGCQKDQRVPAFNVNQKHPDACGILCSTLSVLNTPFKRITEYKFNNVSSSREIHALQTKPAHNQVYNLEKRFTRKEQLAGSSPNGETSSSLPPADQGVGNLVIN